MSQDTKPAVYLSYEYEGKYLKVCIESHEWMLGCEAAWNTKNIFNSVTIQNRKSFKLFCSKPSMMQVLMFALV